jgi:bacteriorhodopsin
VFDHQIADLILRQVWWIVGSFAFLFVFSVIVMRSFFVSLLASSECSSQFPAHLSL